MDLISEKVIKNFGNLNVRKDLTSYMKRTANVPGYVIEYLLGMYCNSQKENVVSEGLKKISKALGENYVKPYEIELIKSKMKGKGSYTIIDCLTVRLDDVRDVYLGTFDNFKIGDIVIEKELVRSYPKLLVGGVWGFIKLVYRDIEDEDTKTSDENDALSSVLNDVFKTEKENNKRVIDSYEEKHKKDFVLEKQKNHRRHGFSFDNFAFILDKFTPIQLATFNISDLKEKRKDFSLEEWMVFILRSVGIEGSELNFKEKMHYIERIVPLFERNYNLVELGPRGTGKSYLYKEISPYSILLSGGNANISSLFYNLTRREVGIVGNWDCVAFDEVTGKTLSNELLVQILKDFMASGSFTRGNNYITADASLVFIGNINDSVENLLRVSHLFAGFSHLVENDSAFFDRVHYYLPGREIPKLSNRLLTSEYGLISDCFAEFAKEMRKYDYGHDFDEFFKLNSSVNTRDEIAIRKTMSGLLKILFPDRSYNENDLKKVLNYAIEGRTRVKNQLKKMSGDEFADTNLGYVDRYGLLTIVNVPEKCADSMISSDTLNPGYVYTAGPSLREKNPSLFRIETKKILGSGNLITQGIISNYSRKLEEDVKAAWLQFKNDYCLYNSSSDSFSSSDFVFYLNDIQNRGATKYISTALYVALTSLFLNKPC